MMRGLAIFAAVGVAALAMEPIAGALAPGVVGVKVPTRMQDLARYLNAAKPEGREDPTLGISTGAPAVTLVGPDLEKLRELAALAVGASLGVGALTYAVLRRVTGG